MSDASVKLFDVFEKAFKQTGTYENPYLETSAQVVLTAPDGEQRTTGLFWDGDTTWRLRFAPDLVGRWQWQTESDDKGLGGQSGQFDVVASDLRGGIEVMDGHPFHFQYQNGERMWFVGDTVWAFVTDNEEKNTTARLQNGMWTNVSRKGLM